MSYCTQCGQPLTLGGRFCAACGAAAPAAAASATPPGAEPAGWPEPAPPSTPAPHSMPVPPVAASPAPPFAPIVPGSAVQYAGFWRRFWGLAIDRICLGIVLLPVGILLGANMLLPFLGDDDMTPEKLFQFLFGSISLKLVSTFVEWVYFAGFQCSPHQATPGQMALGLRVTGLNGERIGFGRASGRYFASWLSAVMLMIGFVMGAFTERRQTLHDMIASTLVARGRAGSS